MSKQVVGARFDDADVERIDQAAAKLGMSRTQYVVQAVQRELARSSGTPTGRPGPARASAARRSLGGAPRLPGPAIGRQQ